MVKIILKYFLHNKYDLCRLKLLLQLVVKTCSLWHYMFRSLMGISIQRGSGPVNIWYIKEYLVFNY
jgi:hypothetical protein